MWTLPQQAVDASVVASWQMRQWPSKSETRIMIGCKRRLGAGPQGPQGCNRLHTTWAAVSHLLTFDDAEKRALIALKPCSTYAVYLDYRFAGVRTGVILRPRATIREITTLLCTHLYI
jgi:hypothetical protein